MRSRRCSMRVRGVAAEGSESAGGGRGQVGGGGGAVLDRGGGGVRFLPLALEGLASEVVADRGVLDVVEIVERVVVGPSRLLIERLHEVAAMDGDAVDRRQDLVGLQRVRRRRRRRTEKHQEPEQDYGVTQPRGQPASAFEYSGCTQAPPVCW